MRIARFVTPLAMAVALLAPAASAATATVSTSGLPSEYSWHNIGGTSYVHVSGPGAPPLGSGSLRLPTDGPAAYLAQTFSGTLLSSLTSFSFGYHQPANATSQVIGMIYASPENASDINSADTLDRAYVTLPATGSWAPADLLHDTELTTYTSTNSTGVVTDPVNQTWTQFLTAHSSDYLLETDIAIGGASQPEYIYLDDLTIGGATAKTYDFEASPTSTLTGASSAAKITYGHSVTVSAKLSRPGGVVAGAHVKLFAKPAGSSAYKRVADVVTNSSGVAKSSRRPTVNTAYRWQFDGNENYGPSTSGTRSVAVARAVTMRIADRTLARRQALFAWGRLTPAATGTVVTVWRTAHGTKVKVGTTKVRSDATWGYSHTLRAGSYRIVATVPATSKNAAGKSPAIGVTAR